MPKCDFCQESANPSYARSFLGAKWPFADRILFEDENIICVPGLGPQVYPYFLLIPRRHVFHVAQLNESELVSVYSGLRYLMRFKETYDETLQVFEHGGCPGSSGACVEHCHLHVISDRIPIADKFRKEFQTESFSLSASSTLGNLGRYLFLGHFAAPAEVHGYLAKGQQVPSQYFRRKISEFLRDDLWDWALELNMPYMVKMMQDNKALDCRSGDPCG